MMHTPTVDDISEHKESVNEFPNLSSPVSFDGWEDVSSEEQLQTTNPSILLTSTPSIPSPPTPSCDQAPQHSIPQDNLQIDTAQTPQPVPLQLVIPGWSDNIKPIDIDLISNAIVNVNVNADQTPTPTPSTSTTPTPTSLTKQNSDDMATILQSISQTQNSDDMATILQSVPQTQNSDDMATILQSISQTQNSDLAETKKIISIAENLNVNSNMDQQTFKEITKGETFTKTESCYQIDDQLLVVDTLGDSLFALVKKIENRRIFISYVSYFSKYDEWLEIDNPRILGKIKTMITTPLQVGDSIIYQCPFQVIYRHGKIVSIDKSFIIVHRNRFTQHISIPFKNIILNISELERQHGFRALVPPSLPPTLPSKTSMNIAQPSFIITAPPLDASYFPFLVSQLQSPSSSISALQPPQPLPSNDASQISAPPSISAPQPPPPPSSNDASPISALQPPPPPPSNDASQISTPPLSPLPFCKGDHLIVVDAFGIKMPATVHLVKRDWVFIHFMGRPFVSELLSTQSTRIICNMKTFVASNLQKEDEVIFWNEDRFHFGTIKDLNDRSCSINTNTVTNAASIARSFIIANISEWFRQEQSLPLSSLSCPSPSLPLEETSSSPIKSKSQEDTCHERKSLSLEVSQSKWGWLCLRKVADKLFQYVQEEWCDDWNQTLRSLNDADRQQLMQYALKQKDMSLAQRLMPSLHMPRSLFPSPFPPLNGASFLFSVFEMGCPSTEALDWLYRHHLLSCKTSKLASVIVEVILYDLCHRPNGDLQTSNKENLCLAWLVRVEDFFDEYKGCNASYVANMAITLALTHPQIPVFTKLCCGFREIVSHSIDVWLDTADKIITQPHHTAEHQRRALQIVELMAVCMEEFYSVNCGGGRFPGVNDDDDGDEFSDNVIRMSIPSVLCVMLSIIAKMTSETQPQQISIHLIRMTVAFSNQLRKIGDAKVRSLVEVICMFQQDQL